LAHRKQNRKVSPEFFFSYKDCPNFSEFFEIIGSKGNGTNSQY